jgi:hypothetical protein
MFTRRLLPTAAATLALALIPAAPARAQGAPVPPTAFTLEQVLSYGYPSELVAAQRGASIAWALNQNGRRNVFVARAPEWRSRQITTYDQDDGQELTSLALTPDGGTVVYARGGDHDANWRAEGDLAPDPSSSPVKPVVRISAVSTAGGAPRLWDTPSSSP